MNTFQETIDRLDSLKDQLPPSARSLATSLIYGRFGWNERVARNRSHRFSGKQRRLVNNLIAQATAPAPTVNEPTQVGSMAGIMMIIERAKQHLKFPKIKLLVDDQDVCIKMAGERSKYTGDLMVTDGRPFGQNKYFGRVSASGEWHKPFRPVEGMDSVESLLTRLSDDPAGTAAEYGKLTGHCCFCSKKLTDDRSTDVGYGKTCASHYGLPWG